MEKRGKLAQREKRGTARTKRQLVGLNEQESPLSIQKWAVHDEELGD